MMLRIITHINFFLCIGFCSLFAQEDELLRNEIKSKVQKFIQLPICEKIRVYDSVCHCLANIDPNERSPYDSTLNYPFQLLNVMERTIGTKCNIFNPIGHFSKNNNKYDFSYWECDLDKEIFLWKKKFGCSDAISLCLINDSLLSLLDNTCIGRYEDTSGIATLYVQLLSKSLGFDSLNKINYTENSIRVYSGELCFLKNSLTPENVQVYSEGNNSLTKCFYYEISVKWSISILPDDEWKPTNYIDSLFTGGIPRNIKRQGKSKYQHGFKLLHYKQINKKDIPLSIIR